MGLTLDLASQVLPIILAIVGVLVSVETPKLESIRARWLWRGGLIVFGLLTTFVIYKQQAFDRQEAVAQTVLRYVPQIVITYGDNRLTVYNQGQTNVYFWGDKVGDDPKDIENDPRIIPQNSFYYLYADLLDKWLHDHYGNEADVRVPFHLFLTNEIKKKYVLTFSFWVRIKDGKISIDTQLLDMKEQDW